MRSAHLRAQPDDRIGGSTLSFDLHPGHPHEHLVYGLLQRVRGQVNALYDEVTRYNREHPTAKVQQTRVYFYFGQGIEDASADDQERETR
jgi:hypothetical protein